MEYQGKELFRRVGIPVPHSRHCTTPDEAAQFVAESAGEWVVKAQVLMGGRGKAGKIKFANTADARRVPSPQEIMATPMPPNRQNPNGEPIQLAARRREAPDREGGVRRDHDRSRAQASPVIDRRAASAAWRSKKSPSSIPNRSPNIYVDTAIGYSPFIGRELAFSAQLDPGYRKAVSGDRRSAVRSLLSRTARSSSRSIRSR